ncbi:vesicle-associated membrane protein 7 [Angomonas deanei]|nr:vesicle-associated membrane protein 7 [Angomonas deanei]|eukprot:EPY40321.1 vesicle-associated membrane protein 7 [Angomonas deanei]
MKDVVVKVLEGVPRYDSKVSYQYGSQMFHCVVENEIVYGCVSPVHFQATVVFGFLSECNRKFKIKYAGSAEGYPRISDLTPSNCYPFGEELSSLMQFFNENPQTDKFSQIKSELDSTRQVMLNNLDSIVARGDQISDLCDRTELLRSEAQGFHTNAFSLKKALLKHHIIVVIGAVVLLGILGLIIAFTVCGVDFKKC